MTNPEDDMRDELGDHSHPNPQNRLYWGEWQLNISKICLNGKKEINIKVIIPVIAPSTPPLSNTQQSPVQLDADKICLLKNGVKITQEY